jgi:hypothetical protein
MEEAKKHQKEVGEFLVKTKKKHLKKTDGGGNEAREGGRGARGFP